MFTRQQLFVIRFLIFNSTSNYVLNYVIRLTKFYDRITQIVCILIYITLYYAQTFLTQIVGIDKRIIAVMLGSLVRKFFVIRLLICNSTSNYVLNYVIRTTKFYDRITQIVCNLIYITLYYAQTFLIQIGGIDKCITAVMLCSHGSNFS